MNESTKTKKALRGSLFALFLCIVLLIGTTFAWFTDTASTGVNKITAGNLKVGLQYKAADGSWKDATTTTLDFQKAKGAENEAILWEPGCKYKLPEIRVINNGNLALKYTIKVTGIQGDEKLNEVIDWTVDGGALDEEQSLAANAQSDPMTIQGHMQESAGNEYQGLSIEGITITVYATQDTVENDSFDNQYDKDAKYPVRVSVSDKEALEGALNNPGVPVDITLTEPISNSNDLTVTGDVTLNLGDSALNQNNSDIVGADLTVENGGSLTINANSRPGFNYTAGKLATDGTGSSLTVNGGEYGDSGSGNANVAARNGSVIYLNSGSFSTSGYKGHAVTAESGATVYIKGGSYGTSGASSSTIYANGGTIVITGLDSIRANGVNYDVDNRGKIILSKAVSSRQPTSIGSGCTVTDDGENWVITKA